MAPIPELVLIFPWELQCPPTRESGIICITINCVTLSIILFMGSVGIKNLIINTQINMILKILFYISFASAMIQLIASIVMLSLCMEEMYILDDFIIPLILFEFGYYFLILCLLATLLARLYTTFEDSMYRLSIRSRIILIIIYTFMLLAFIGIITLFIMTLLSCLNDVDTSQTEGYRDVYKWLVLFTWIVYILCALWTVYMFCKNILSLATLQIDSASLNTFQQKMISLSSKYVSLFAVALIASLTVMIFWSYQGLAVLSVPIICTVAGIDAAINIISLFLQYSFAKTYYNKYFGFIDFWFKQPLTIYMERRITQSMQNSQPSLIVNHI